MAVRGAASKFKNGWPNNNAARINTSIEVGSGRVIKM